MAACGTPRNVYATDTYTNMRTWREKACTQVHCNVMTVLIQLICHVLEYVKNVHTYDYANKKLCIVYIYIYVYLQYIVTYVIPSYPDIYEYLHTIHHVGIQREPPLNDIYIYSIDVSKNSGTPKSSILIGFSMIFTIHFGVQYPYFWKHPYIYCIYI